MSMNRYDLFLVGMYLVALFAVVVGLTTQLAVVMLLFFIIVLLQKIVTDKEVEKVKQKREETDKLVVSFSEKLDNFSKRIEDINSNMTRSIMFVDNKIAEVRQEYKTELETHYRDMAVKMGQIEDRLGEIRRTIGAAFGTLEERLESVEEKEEFIEMDKE